MFIRKFLDDELTRRYEAGQVKTDVKKLKKKFYRQAEQLRIKKRASVQV